MVNQALSDATAQAMNDSSLLARLAEQGMFADLHIGDVAAGNYVKAEMAKWKPIIAKLGNLT